MSISKRDAHLKEFFSAEVLKELDQAEKTVLYEEFANSELRILASQSTETIHNRLKVHLEAEHKRRLTAIQPEEYELLKDWYLENCHTVSEIICGKCKALLGLELDTIDDSMNPYHHEGKFIVPIGDKLMAYRPRLDGVMGFHCGNIIETKYKKAWDEYDGEAAAELQAEREKNNKQYDEEFMAYGRLDKKAKAKAKAPVLVEVDVPEPPAGPPYEECGNYTLWSQIELDNIAEDHVMTSITKEDRIKVKQEMNISNYSPDVKETKSGKKIETFELRKVK